MMGWFGRQRKPVLQASTSGVRRYGGDDTFHRTGWLDVEVRDGKVIAVWFRCQALPFQQRDVNELRASEMARLQAEPLPTLHAVEVQDR